MEHIKAVYKKIEDKFNISTRNVRFYVTEKLIPQPEHIGREAYYDVDKIQLFERIELIKILQKHSFSIKEIRDIMNKFKNATIRER